MIVRDVPWRIAFLDDVCKVIHFAYGQGVWFLAKVFGFWDVDQGGLLPPSLHEVVLPGT